MKAQVGDRIVLAGEQVDRPTRDGEVLEVRGANGEPPYLVRWGDGHTGLLYPGPGSVLRIGAAHGTEAPPTPVPRPVKEWQVRVSIFETGDETTAKVVLVADAPGTLSASGESHRSGDDEPATRIGDEVAVARALRHLADELLDAATRDIETSTGEVDVFVRPR